MVQSLVNVASSAVVILLKLEVPHFVDGAVVSTCGHNTRTTFTYVADVHHRN